MPLQNVSVGLLQPLAIAWGPVGFVEVDEQGIKSEYHVVLGLSVIARLA